MSNDWSTKFGNLGQVVQDVSFKETEASFAHKVEPRRPGAVAFIGDAKIRAKDHEPVNVLVRIPKDLIERLEANSTGGRTTNIAMLLDFALDHLITSNLSLTTTNKPTKE